MCALVGNAEPVSSEAESAKPDSSESSSAAMVESASVDVAASGSQRDPSSVGPPLMAPQPLPPPPPPPLPSAIHPVDPAFVSYFPALPPPPVELFPVRLPPRHTHPDVRWTLRSAAPASLAGAPPLLQPPPVFLPTPHSVCPSHRFTAAEQHKQIPYSRESRHPSATATSRSSLSSSVTVSNAAARLSAGKSSGTPIVRDFKAKGATPRFVPRQLHSASASDKVPANPDPVIEELKQNAFVLSSKVQGPSLPSQTERKRKEFKTSETGSESIDKTVHDIRQKVTQVRCRCQILVLICFLLHSFIIL